MNGYHSRHALSPEKKNNVSLISYYVPPYSINIVNTRWAIKTCHLVFDYNSGFSWSIFILFVLPVKQEGILYTEVKKIPLHPNSVSPGKTKTRRMAIANGTCVSFCYQPITAHYLATSRLSRRYVVAFYIYSRFAAIAAFRHLATSRESKAHFGLPWVRLWDYRGKCYMDGKRIQCLSNASWHVPIYLQPFPSNSTRKFKNSPF